MSRRRASRTSWASRPWWAPGSAPTPKINEREIAGVIEVARAGHADIVAVGNEVLLREDMDEDELLACIQRVKDALPGVPVGYVDAYYLFELHPRITAACDVVLTNCYPFWEGCPREGALAYMQSMVRRTRAAAPGKRIVISETGWPDQGSAFHGSVPSTEGAMAYFVDTLQWAEPTASRSSTSPPSTRPGRSAPKATSGPTGACGTRTANPSSRET